MRGDDDKVAVGEADHDISVAVPFVVDHIAVLLLKSQLNRPLLVVQAEQEKRAASDYQANCAFGILTLHVLFAIGEY